MFSYSKTVFYFPLKEYNFHMNNMLFILLIHFFAVYMYFSFNYLPSS